MDAGRNMGKYMLAALVCLSLSAGTAWAMPQGGTVVVGGSDVVIGAASGGSMEIGVNAPGLIDWNSFSIANGEKVNFAFGGAKGLEIINHVTGSTLSEIFGTLSSTGNGHVTLINPNGITVGNNAVIDVGGLTLSTLQVDDTLLTKFLNGEENLVLGDGSASTALLKIGDGAVINSTGSLELYGGKVQIADGVILNAGSNKSRFGLPGKMYGIDFSSGDVSIAAGNKVIPYRNKHLYTEMEGTSGNSLILNNAKINTAGSLEILGGEVDIRDSDIRAHDTIVDTKENDLTISHSNFVDEGFESLGHGCMYLRGSSIRIEKGSNLQNSGTLTIGPVATSVSADGENTPAGQRGTVEISDSNLTVDHGGFSVHAKTVDISDGSHINTEAGDVFVYAEDMKTDVDGQSRQVITKDNYINVTDGSKIEGGKINLTGGTVTLKNAAINEKVKSYYWRGIIIEATKTPIGRQSDGKDIYSKEESNLVINNSALVADIDDISLSGDNVTIENNSNLTAKGVVRVNAGDIYEGLGAVKFSESQAGGRSVELSGGTVDMAASSVKGNLYVEAVSKEYTEASITEPGISVIGNTVRLNNLVQEVPEGDGSYLAAKGGKIDVEGEFQSNAKNVLLGAGKSLTVRYTDSDASFTTDSNDDPSLISISDSARAGMASVPHVQLVTIAHEGGGASTSGGGSDAGGGHVEPTNPTTIDPVPAPPTQTGPASVVSGSASRSGGSSGSSGVSGGGIIPMISSPVERSERSGGGPVTAYSAAELLDASRIVLVAPGSQNIVRTVHGELDRDIETPATNGFYPVGESMASVNGIAGVADSERGENTGVKINGVNVAEATLESSNSNAGLTSDEDNDTKVQK